MTSKEIYRKVKRIIDRAEINTVFSLNINVIAQRIGVHPSRISRAFKEHHKYPETPHKYLKYKQIWEYNRWFTSYFPHYKSEKEILEDLGVGSHSHFIKKYKSVKYSLTPGKERRLNREDESQTRRKGKKEKID